MSEKVFMAKEEMPTEEKISEKLVSVYFQLESIRQHLLETLEETREEWKFFGKKGGWILKILLKKRNLFFIGIYEGYFRITFVFGEKAFKVIMDSDLSAELKSYMEGARKYAEGRGLSITVDGPAYLEDIKKLIRIKIEN